MCVLRVRVRVCVCVCVLDGLRFITPKELTKRVENLIINGDNICEKHLLLFILLEL